MSLAILAASLMQATGAAASGSAPTPGATTPDLTYSPARINFGKVAALSTASGHVVITNTNSVDLQFAGALFQSGSSITFGIALGATGDDCLTSLSAGVLHSGSSCTMTVLFAPLTRGRYKDTFLTEWLVGSVLTDVTATTLVGSS